MCKFVVGLLTKKCKLFLGRDSSKDEQRLQFWITANGLSFGRTLDDNKQLTALSGKQANNNYSRRVEFRIITTSETLIEQVLKEISK